LFYAKHKNHEDISQGKLKMNFRKFTWKLVDGFRNFCMNEETEEVCHQLKALIYNI